VLRRFPWPLFARRFAGFYAGAMARWAAEPARLVFKRQIAKLAPDALQAVASHASFQTLRAAPRRGPAPDSNEKSQFQISLSAKGFTNPPMNCYGNDFTLTVGGSHHQCFSFVPHFVSRRLCCLRSINTTIANQLSKQKMRTTLCPNSFPCVEGQRFWQVTRIAISLIQFVGNC
jgi:hypothetical protein